MAHCIAVTENAIRVQLPGGAVYAPALHEAAAKIGARSGLAKRQATALSKMVKASVALINDGNPTTVTLEMWVHEDSISARVSGAETKRPTKKALAKLEAFGENNAQSLSTKATKSAFTISFVV